MTVNELNTSKWQDFVYDLVEAKKKGLQERDYQAVIETGFRTLGWNKARGEICPWERINVGANNQLEPDITFRINGEAVFVVEVKQPTNRLTQRQIEQLFSYMRMRKVPFGLYIGDEIKLFYDCGADVPSDVFTFEIDIFAMQGWRFVDFFARSMFSTERLKAFCAEKFKEIQSTNQWEALEYSLKENADEAIKNLIHEYLVKMKKCDESIVNKHLETYVFRAFQQQEVKDEKIENEPTPEITTTRYVLQKHGRNRNSAGRDTTKFSLDGGKTFFGKGKFVREIVAAYLSQHPSITFTQIEQIFPKELQGSYGVVRRVDDIYSSGHDLQDLKMRYVMAEDKILCTKDGIRFVVYNQWGSYNFPHVLEMLEKWGWNIVKETK